MRRCKTTATTRHSESALYETPWDGMVLLLTNTASATERHKRLIN